MILRFNLLISLLGLLIAIHAVAAAKMDMKKCPKRNGLFPKPGSMCKGYYQCQNFIPVEWKCPKDKHFNTLINKCDWENNFHCLEKPKSKVCTEANGKFLKPGTSCKYYYDCCNGKPTEKKCPPEKIFDPFKKKCEWRELYICEEDISTDNTKTTSPTTKEIKYSTPKESDESSSQETTKQSDESSSQETSTESDESHSKEIEYSTAQESEATPSEDLEYSTAQESEATPSEDLEYSTAQESEATPSEDLEYSTAQKSEATSPEEIEYSTAQQSEATSNDEKEYSTARESEATSPEEIEYSTAQESEATSPEELEYSTAQESEATSPEKIEYSTAQESEATSTEEIEYSTAEESGATSPEEIEYSTAQESEATSLEKIEYSTLKFDETTSEQDTEFTNEESTIEELQQSTASDIDVGITDEESLTTFDLSKLTNEPNLFCPERFGYHPHPFDKHKFVGCVDYIPNILSCPHDLIYNHEEKQCVYQE